MSEQIPDPKRSAILVVDDSRVIRIALQRILQGSYTVYEASDGEQALEQLQGRDDIGLVLTDLSMPGMDGQDLLMRIREGAAGVPAELPVAIVTGQEGDEQASEGWAQLGASAVLMKPFVPGRVREVVSQFMPDPSTETAPDGGLSAEQAQGLRDEIERLRRELMLRQQSTSERDTQRELERLHAALGESRDDATAAYQRAEEAEQALEELRERLERAESSLADAGAEDAGAADSPPAAVPSEEQAAFHEEQATLQEELKGRIRELEGETVRLEHELIELERDRDKVRARVQEVEGEVERLRRERNQQSERAAKSEAARAELEAQCAERDGSASALNERLAERERQLAETVERNKALRARVRDLERELSGGPAAAPDPAAVQAMSREAEVLEAAGQASLRSAAKAGTDSSAPRTRSRVPWLRVALVLSVVVVVALGVMIVVRGL
ncbi:MAG: response regulator [Pseudomonadota bacterium]